MATPIVSDAAISNGDDAPSAIRPGMIIGDGERHVGEDRAERRLGPSLSDDVERDQHHRQRRHGGRRLLLATDQGAEGAPGGEVQRDADREERRATGERAGDAGRQAPARDELDQDRASRRTRA